MRNGFIIETAHFLGFFNISPPGRIAANWPLHRKEGGWFSSEAGAMS
jgi:hypothetical protein